MRQVILISVALMGTCPVAAEDWPQWRGPRADGTWQAPKLPREWPRAGLRTVWRQPVGGGYAGVTVLGGRVYTLDLEAPIAPRPKDAPEDDRPDGFERVRCFEATSGREVWSHRYPVRYGNLGGYANGPRTSVTIRDGRAYSLGAVGHLYCFDAASGKVIWQHDTVKEYGARVPEWGFAGSPVVDGELVITHLGAARGGCVVAFDRHTGQEKWRALDDPAGYCTPALFDTAAGRILVVWTPRHIHALDPTDGRSLWRVPYEVTYGVSIAGPICQEGIVFVTGYWEGSKAIRLGARLTDQELLWTDNKNLRGLMAQPLYRDGHVYMIDKDRGLTCFELKTGRKIWDDDNTLTPRGRNPPASIVWLNDGDRALALNSRGELILCRLNPQGYQEESRTRILSGRVWGHPALSGRFLYAKTDGAEAWRTAGACELVCVELVPPEKPE